MKETTLCFLLKDDKVLLAMKKRGFGSGKWNGVGGKLKEEESAKPAAMREISEEIGVTVALQDLQEMGSLEFNYQDNPDWHQLCHIFIVRNWRGEPGESEEMKPAWYPIDKLPFDEMWIDDPHWLPLVLAGKKIEGKFLFDMSGGAMIGRDVKDMSFKRRSAFTLIELLIVIAIIAILSVVVVLVLNPAQLLQQSRDTNRISDMSTLNTALSVYQAQGGGSPGLSNVVYVSIPDPAATTTLGDQCQGLGLISLPATYTYHCAATSTYRAVDSTGWIPINFTTISSGAPIGQLPVDPINTSSSREYYTYTTNGTQYEVTSVMESSKYQIGGSSDIISGDGGYLASVYERGNAFGLEPLDYGDNTLVGYWTLNEGTGSVAYDYSGNNATGSWNGTQAGTNGYYSAGKGRGYTWAGTFSSTTVNTSFQYSLTGNSSFTWSGWINLISFSGTPTLIGNRNGSVWAKITPASFEYGSGAVVPYAFPTGSWQFAAITKSGSNFSYYLNGVLVGTGSNGASVTNLPFYMGGDPNYPADGYPHLLIDDVRLYDRALSATQILAMYSGGK